MRRIVTRTRPQLDRLVFCGLGLILAWIIIGAFDVRGRGDDWRIFWNAGHYVGTKGILTSSHFVYTPGVAWLLWPFAHLSLATGYFIFVAIMVALASAAGWLASRVYRLPFSVCLLMALAWGPFTIAICLGQNSPLALLLVTSAIFAIARDDRILAGISAGLLLYKPSDAISLIFLLLILRWWRSLGVAAVFAVGWYLLSASATSDWLWPVLYVHTLAALYHTDIAMNSDFAISVPTMLTRLGVPTMTAWTAGAAILLGSAPLLLRVSRLEAASMAPLIGVVASPHAWGYEAILALPALWLTATRLNPLRAILLWTAYAIAPIYLFVRVIHFNALVIPVLGGASLWFWIQLRSLFAQRLSRQGVA
jgi:hypothetical protein